MLQAQVDHGRCNSETLLRTSSSIAERLLGLYGFVARQLPRGFLFRRVLARSASACAAALTLALVVAPDPVIAQSQPALSDVEDRCRPGAVPDYDNVRSLEDIFEVVERGVGGEIIKAELQQRSFVDVCVWVYDVKVLTDAGDVKRVAYDASDLRLIGFSMPATVNPRPLFGADTGTGISAAPSTSAKTLNNPDADGVADSGGDDSAAAAGTDTDAAATDAAADASAAADSSAADAAQRDGKADGTDSAGASDSDTASESDQSAGGGAASSAGGSTDGSAAAEGTTAN